MHFNPRILIVAIHDLIMSALSFELAVAARYYSYGAPQEPFFLWQGTIIFTTVCSITFWRTGLYRGIWHYASLNDLIGIVKATSLAILIFLPMLFFITRLEDFPRTSLLINWPLLIILLAGPRFLYRALKDGNLRLAFQRLDTQKSQIPILLAGASDQAESFIREISRSHLSPYRVVGIIDNKPGRVGRNIRGVRIFATLNDFVEAFGQLRSDELKPQRLVIASDSYSGEEIQKLLSSCEQMGMTLARLPRLTDFQRGDSPNIFQKSNRAQTLEPRPIDVEDLLGRPQKVLDRLAMRNLVAGRSVLVTGSGGTIGSELCRQIAAYEPQRLIILDNAEFNIYRIDEELGRRYPELSRRTVLSDIRDSERIKYLLCEEKPQLLFHTAAFKHVPLVEQNIEEGVLTNIIGTQNIADACEQAGVGAMVLISTDKAVAPTSVMGATKRIAELYCQAKSMSSNPLTSKTRYLIVRFGNVLGSTGSVVPLFTRQIAAGGPVTVTDPEVTRYFMTTQEAVELVLQACSFQTKKSEIAGKIYVLDMGIPVKILDLAHQMIRLAGFRPEKDIPLTFCGLRPGEKLHEELFGLDEKAIRTQHEAIRLASSQAEDLNYLRYHIQGLEDAARKGQAKEVLRLISLLVPDYKISSSR